MTNQRLTIPSVPNSISQLEDFIKITFHKYNINPDRYPDILISLTEAVNNAIIHGNKGDRKKKVKIRLKQKNSSIIFVVSDEGCGFDVNELPDPTTSDNIECCGGRGVFIMTKLCDQIYFQNNGSTVEMCFHV